MATSSVTLYPVSGVGEVFNLDSVVGKKTYYTGATSTPTFPVSFEITKDQKSTGDLGNDRIELSTKRAASASAQATVRTSSATLKVSVAKDPSSASALLLDAQNAVAQLVSYITGDKLSETALANVAKVVSGILL